MKRVEEIIDNTISMWDELKKEKPPVVLYGMGDGAVKLLKILDTIGVKCIGIFASDSFVRYQSFMGFTVKKLRDLEDEFEDFTILSAFATRLDEVMDNFYTISKRHPLKIPDINVSGACWEVFDNAFAKAHRDRIIRVYDALDPLGKEFFEALLLYKMTGELEYLNAIEECRQKEMLPYDAKSIRTFADFGAYTGDTIRDAVKLYPNLTEVAGYEPDARNYKKLERTVAGLDIKAHLFEGLVWNKNEKLFLRSGGAMNTIITGNVKESDNLQKKKEVLVDAFSADSSLPFLPDLIKMDVEGCEIEAIDGCLETISACKPIIRASIYHNHRHIFEVYEALSRLNPNYRFTLSQKCRYIPAWDIELVAYN